MNDDAAFLRAIREDPDDDAPRLVYADWLDEQAELVRRRGEPVSPDPDPEAYLLDEPPARRPSEADSLTARAEFIRVQCELARLAGPADPADSRRLHLRSRESALLGTWFGRWRARLVDGPGWRWGPFERGFVERLDVVDLGAFVPAAAQLFEQAPVRSLRVTNLGLEGLRRLAALPQLARVSTLDLADNLLGDEAVAVLAGSPYLSRLASLRLAGNALDDPGARALAVSVWPRLAALDLSRNEIGDEGAQALAAAPALSGLHRLDLSENALDDAGATALAASPHLSGLDALDLRGNDLTPGGVRAVVAAPLGPRVATPSPGSEAPPARAAVRLPLRRRGDWRIALWEAGSLVWNGGLVGFFFGAFVGGVALLLGWLGGASQVAEGFMAWSLVVSVALGLAAACFRLADVPLSWLARLPGREVVGLAVGAGLAWALAWWAGVSEGRLAALASAFGVTLAWAAVDAGQWWWGTAVRPPRWRGPPQVDALLIVQAALGAVAGFVGGLLGGLVFGSVWGVAWAAGGGLVVGGLFSCHARLVFEVAMQPEAGPSSAPSENLDDSVYALAVSGGGAGAILFAGLFLDGLPDFGPISLERARPWCLAGAFLGGALGAAVACGKPRRRFHRLKADLLYRRRSWWRGLPAVALVLAALTWSAGAWLAGVERPRFLTGLSTPAACVALSPDEARAAAGAEDGEVAIWELASGRLLRRFRGHAGRVHSVAFSPDGARLVTASADGSVRLWNAEDGQELSVLRAGESPLVCGVFVAGGRVLTGAADGSLALWPVGPGGPLWVSGAPDPAQPATVTSAASAAVGFDADTALVLLLNGQLQRVSLADGTREELPVGPVKAFTIAAEGLIVAGPEGRPRLVDPETGSVRAEFRTGRPMSALAFGPDGRLTELRTTPTGRLQDAETGRLLRHYPYPLAGVAVPVDRRHLLAGVGRGLGWLPWPDGGVP